MPKSHRFSIDVEIDLFQRYYFKKGNNQSQFAKEIGVSQSWVAKALSRMWDRIFESGADRFLFPNAAEIKADLEAAEAGSQPTRCPLCGSCTR